MKKLILSLEEKLGVVPNLPGVRRNLRAQALISDEQLKQECERHRRAVEDIAAQFDLECWRAVKDLWSDDEIEKAIDRT